MPAKDVSASAFESACDALSDQQELILRDLLARIASRWHLWVLTELAAAPGPLRFSRLLEGVEGVSQKVLTQALRGLERDGLLTRVAFLEIPPRVEYSLTPLGSELLAHVLPLWSWAASRAGEFEAARTSFDSRGESDV